MESHRAKSFGKRAEILWECFRSTVGAAWDTVDQNIIERSLESGGDIMGIPWEMLWEYYGKFMDIVTLAAQHSRIKRASRSHAKPGLCFGVFWCFFEP